MIKLLKKWLRDAKPKCPRCGTPFEGTGEKGFYCEPCHTTFETVPDIRYDEPTRGIEYRLTGKSSYGKR